jgi:hypothetical protein
MVGTTTRQVQDVTFTPNPNILQHQSRGLRAPKIRFIVRTDKTIKKAHNYCVI